MCIFDGRNTLFTTIIWNGILVTQNAHLPELGKVQGGREVGGTCQNCRSETLKEFALDIFVDVVFIEVDDHKHLYLE